MKQLIFIINPKAGNGYALKIWKKVELELKSENLAYLAFFTEYPGHAEKLAHDLTVKSKEEKIMVAVGGDGTVHEVVNGIMKVKVGAQVILGFIPGGSGNDFSRGFYIPNTPILAYRTIVRLMKQEGISIDIGKLFLDGSAAHYFINNMGAGFDAEIAYEVNRSRIKAILNKISLGKLVYVYFLLKKVFTYKTSTIDLSIDGKKHIFESTWFVTVSNQPYYGGGMKIAPNAMTDDGFFDITVVHQLSRLKLLLIFISVFWGKHLHFKEVNTFKGKDISIQSSESLFVHGDGEHIGYTPLNVQIQTKALQLLTRKQRQEDAKQKERDLNEI